MLQLQHVSESEVILIYEPRLAFDLRIALAEGIIQALILAIGDFIAEDNKAWTYYTGAALGYTAAATGIPNAAATMYVVGESVDMVFFHSPDGSDVQVFLDGVLEATIDGYTPDVGGFWGGVALTIAEGVVHRIDVINSPSTNGDKTSEINWLGIGAVTVNGAGAQVRRPVGMSYDTINFKLMDAEGGRPAYFPHRVASGLSETAMQTEIDTFAPLLDAVTGAVIESCTILRVGGLPAGLKTDPIAASLNERGGLFSGSTNGTRSGSVWVPAIRLTLAPNEGAINITQTAIDALLDHIVSDGRTEFDNSFVEFLRGKRSIRKR